MNHDTEVIEHEITSCTFDYSRSSIYPFFKYRANESLNQIKMLVNVELNLFFADVRDCDCRIVVFAVKCHKSLIGSVIRVCNEHIVHRVQCANVSNDALADEMCPM